LMPANAAGAEDVEDMKRQKCGLAVVG